MMVRIAKYNKNKKELNIGSHDRIYTNKISDHKSLQMVHFD